MASDNEKISRVRPGLAIGAGVMGAVTASIGIVAPAQAVDYPSWNDVQQAKNNVANQQAKYENLQKSFTLQSQQVDVLKQSVDVSNTLFQSARADYMEVLLTRRDSLDAQMELIETRLAMLESMVNMYQALGGGWQAPAKPQE